MVLLLALSTVSGLASGVYSGSQKDVRLRSALRASVLVWSTLARLLAMICCLTD